jgi:tetratricopeptide (TPR) repeat protein
MLRTILPCLLLLAAPAAAQDNPEQILENIFTAQHECDRLMPQLDAAVDANPSWVKPRLDRAECLYRVGRYEWVIDDLDVVFNGRSVNQAIDAATTGGVPDSIARVSVENGAVVRIIMLLDTGQTRPAKSLYSAARKVFDDSAAMARADIAIDWYTGNNNAAWKAVDAGLEQWPGEHQIEQAVREMASRDPRGITDAADGILSAPANTIGWYNNAVSAYSSGDYSTCLSTIDMAIAEPTISSDHERFLKLGYTCAVTAGDLKKTNQFIVKMGGISGLRSDAVVLHAELLYKNESYAAALELLRHIAPADAAQRVEVETLQVRASTRKGDLDGAMAFAAQNNTEASALANLALALHNAGRTDEAKTILEPACSQMQGADATRCYDFLATLSRG